MYNTFMESLEAELREEEKIFKFRDVVLSGRLLTVHFLANYLDVAKKYTVELKQKVYEIIQKLLPKEVQLSVEVHSTETLPESVVTKVFEHLYKVSPANFNYFSEREIRADVRANELILTIPIEECMADFCEKLDLRTMIEDFLDRNYMETPVVDFEVVPNEKAEILFKKPKISKNLNKIRLIEIEVKSNIIGRTPHSPRYICDVKEKECSGVSVCGRITAKKEIKYKQKEGSFFTYTISDTTGFLPVKIFPRTLKSGDALRNIPDNIDIVCEGNVEKDEFSHANTLLAKSLATCVINHASINVDSDFKVEEDDYLTVFPVPVIEEVQDTFDTVENIIPEALSNMTYVVFDLETTGKDPMNDTITEIGAVKIVDGVITETFSTLVNPRRKLTDEIIELTGITDEMLAGQPILDDVIGDFYKFTRGATLVAHNAPFDVGFITFHGKKLRYNFDNPYSDTLVLSRQRLSIKNHKLATVCEALGVSLVGAHRAVNDAMATAQVFKRLLSKKVL